MAAERYNLIVLGGGPGGYTAALTAARHKARVALVEAQAIGGTCLHWGCIPVKSLLHSAPTLDSPTPGGDWGTHWKASQKRMREQVSALMQGLTKTLKQAGVALVEGKGYVASPNSVRVGGALLETDAIILATGSKPATIPAAGLGDESSSLENWVVGNSNDFLSLDDLPKSLLIVGAGAIGCEFADLMKRYGVEVCLAEMLPQILPHFDMQIAQTLSRSFKKRGIEVRTGTGLNGITPDRSGVLATFQDGSSFSTDRVLVAVGRKPRIEDEVIAGVNIEISDGAVVVNEHFQTSVPNLFAVGDMIGGAYLLAHAAEAQGEHAALTALGMTTSWKRHTPEATVSGRVQHRVCQSARRIPPSRSGRRWWTSSRPRQEGHRTAGSVSSSSLPQPGHCCQEAGRSVW